MSVLLEDEVIVSENVRIYIVKDATDPVGTCEPHHWPWFEGFVLADYVPKDLIISDKTTMRLNGYPLNREHWDRAHELYEDHAINPGDELHIFAIPGGLGVLLAVGLGTTFGTSTAAGITLTTYGIIVAGVTETIIGAGLSYLSAMMIEPPSIPDSVPDFAYGAGGVQNSNALGSPISIVYGKKRKAGTLIRFETGHAGGNQFSKGKYGQINYGNGRTLTQYALCEGPVQSIGGSVTPMNRHWFSTEFGSKRVIYNHLKKTIDGVLYLRNVATSQSLAFFFHVMNEPAYITHIKINMRRYGTIAAGKKIWIEIQSHYAGGPNNVNLMPAIEMDCNLIPQSPSEIVFTLPTPISLAVNNSNYPYWVVIHGDFDVHPTKCIGMHTILTSKGYGNCSLYSGSAWVPAVQSLRDRVAIADIICQPERYQGDSGEVKINGSSIEAFTNEGNVSTRLGIGTQEEMPTISTVTFAQPIGSALVSKKSFVNTTENEVNGFAVVYLFSGGHYRIDSGGSRQPARFVSEIRWRINGTTEWKGFDNVDVSFLWLHPDVFTHRVDFTRSKELDGFIGEIIDVEVKLIVPGEGEGVGKIHWQTLNEYSDLQPQTFPLLAYMQLELDLASSQGAVNSVSALIEGRIMEVFDGTLYQNIYSESPADCCRDYLLHPRFGMGDILHRGNVDDDSFYEWQTEANTSIEMNQGEPYTGAKYTLGLDINQVEPSWDQAARIATAGRAKLLFWGNKIRACVDKHRETSQLFNGGNIELGSFKITFIGKRKRPNVVDVKFWNEDDEDNVGFGHAEDDSMREEHEPDIIETVELKGCTKQYQADRHAQYLLNQAKYIGFMVEWTSSLESVHCEPGHNALLANSAPQWETVHGKVTHDAGANSIRLDQPLVIDDSGKPYRITVQVVSDADGLEYFEHRTIDEVSSSSFDAGDTIDITPAWTANRYPKANDRYSIRPIRTHTDDTVDSTEPGAWPIHIVTYRPLQDHRMRFKAVQYDSRVHDDTPKRKVQQPKKTIAVIGENIPPAPGKFSSKMEPSQREGMTKCHISWDKASWKMEYRTMIWVRQEGIGVSRFTAYPGGITSGNTFEFDPLVPGTSWSVALVPLGPNNERWNPNDTRQRTTVRTIDIQRFFDPKTKVYKVGTVRF